VPLSATRMAAPPVLTINFNIWRCGSSYDVPLKTAVETSVIGSPGWGPSLRFIGVIAS
jgi:hypothetical protein